MSEAGASFAIEARGVVFRYGERAALAGLDLAVPAGSVFGLLGPNGSGKSTFVSLLAAMEAPHEGDLRVFGEPIAPHLRARSGTAFQENAQDPLLTPLELLDLAGALFGLPARQRRERALALLGVFGLADRARDPIATLSGGMRRRLEVARALLHDPALLVLDEPTTGVDPGERAALWEALRAAPGRPRTILLATNDLAEADGVCTHVTFLREGRAVASGTPAALKAGLRRESLIVELLAAEDAELALLAGLPGAAQVAFDGTTAHIATDSAATLVPRLFETLPGRVRAVRIQEATLEDAYFQHVGRRAQPAVAVAQ